jgi:hypothetical protein
MIPADKLETIAKGIVKKMWMVKNGWAYAIETDRDELTALVEIILACGAAHEAHQRKHGR